MAILKPFHGIRYNPEKISDMATVISQPYDRVRHGLQDKYYALSDYNIVHIIKGKEFDGDTTQENVYTRANAFLQEWLKNGVLKREEKPALYVYHQEFTLNGRQVTRKAVIGALELVRFDEGVVLPHERTHDGPKMDRLNLTRATEAYFGNIFILYPDRQNKVDALLDAAIQRPPDVDVRELFEKDVRQKLWVVTDEAVLDAVRAEMAPKTGLIIADGHHRYETALAYRDEQRAKYPDAPPDAAFNYLMVALVSMSDPGLTILPTHRLIYDYAKMTADEVLAKAAAFFEIEKVADRAALEAGMKAALGKTGCFGMALSKGFYLLKLKDVSVMNELAGEHAKPWRELDVSILHKLLLEHIMGIPEAQIDAKQGIEYLREPDLGYERAANDPRAFLFIVNATRMEQITACTAVGEKMPQKSTDFYPKIITGLAMLSVAASETIG